MISEIIQSIHDSIAFKFSNKQKLEATLLKSVKLGCSYVPEHYILKGFTEEQHLELLRILIFDLGIKDIRLGIRWKKVWKDGEIDFTYYQKILEFCLQSNTDICLCVGPIKSPRWPEEFVPENLSVENPVTAGSAVAFEAYDYLNKLFGFLKTNYQTSELDKISTIQIENEAFNEFGTRKLKLTKDYVQRLLEITRVHFPDKKVLLSSAGRNDLKEILKLVDDKSKFTIGYNYYYKTPGQQKYPIIKWFDNIVIAKFGSLSLNNLHRENVDIEVTELQAEPWLKGKSPGHDYNEFLWALFRCTRRLPVRNKILIRYWGIEHLVKGIYESALDAEQHKIINSIMSHRAHSTSSE